MKKNAIFTLSGFVLLLGLASCGKTTKGKLANDWKVTSSEEQWDSESDAGKSSRTTVINGASYSSTYIHQPPGGATETVYETGTVSVNDFTINKDGTWLSVRDITKTLGNESNKSKMEESGTWSFIEKTKGDDFKKNERVLFNVLAVKHDFLAKTNDSITYQSTTTSSYLTGEIHYVYTITGSKKKKLEMELERDNTFVSGSESMNKSLQKLVLEEK